MSISTIIAERRRKGGDILSMLRFDEEVLEWIRTALKESHDDETRYQRQVVDKLQKEYKRLEAMYVNKLDGKIGERFYEQKSAEWREDQQDIRCRLEEHETLQSPIWTKASA
jgi:site-specific DNA recombinase